ncbi:Nucleoside-diphosphate-sugar epimerase [Enhydrobacter aerosaccus]|uniref:Nucleoside-diphosphate-sugar epimerase n=1 Tax=Enhydrobacter aerosaccus TaxID=225324 RepID=A0A1T4THQ0_9HYPH|nr:NAD(P)-dependent oxidoreductase [Enhydrobacter aerosaccus]SKA39934.1 Nucleoside-diphosphate-sugar epimerase [Enhydrobacter aerosaccus]
MKALVTGSSGHLGEALMRRLACLRHDAVGLDIIPGPFTSRVGGIADRHCIADCMAGVEVVFHAAALHKPHVATHSRQDFIDTNITGTLTLLEEAVRRQVRAFIFTSTTSVFGDALIPPPEAPCAWITEEVPPVPKNIYGVTKAAGEDLCHLFHRNQDLPSIVLRTSRFFPEEDDSADARALYDDANLKANEFLFRRVELEDVVEAHLQAAAKAAQIGFGRYIVSATTPFGRHDLADLRADATAVVRRYVPDYVPIYERRGWTMMPTVDRVYVNARARCDLGWAPHFDFRTILDKLEKDNDIRSPLAKAVGSKGYHSETFEEGPYPVDDSARRG